MMRALVFGCVVALVASGAAAQLVEDFESGNSFSNGTVVANPEGTGNVLYVEGVTAVLTLGTPLTAGQGISMKVYDQAKSALDDLTDPMNPIPAADSRPAGHIYGWNVGVTGTYNWGVACINKTFLGGNGGYAWTGVYFDSWPQTGSSVFSTTWAGLPRQVGPGGLSLILGGTIAAPEIPGDGAWSTWSYVLGADGVMTITNDGSAVVLASDPLLVLETTITQVFAGSVSGNLGGVWIDDVTIISGGGKPGDLDGDGDVDLDDFVILKNSFGIDAGGDCDNDGDTDLDDFVILKNNFGL